MEGSFEALAAAVGNGNPVIEILLRCDVALEEELEIPCVANLFGIHAVVASQCATGDGYGITLDVEFGLVLGEVEEVLEQVELALVGIGGGASVDVNLGIALHFLVVDEHVVLGVAHHGIDVVVVGHGELHSIGIGLAQVGLGVVGYYPIELYKSIDYKINTYIL